MVKAVFLDFYGTLVHEDGEPVRIISKRIAETGCTEDDAEVRAFWWQEFQRLSKDAYGEGFRTQRAIEHQSVENTLRHFKSTEEVERICDFLFEGWIKPPIFDEAKEFFEHTPVPIYMVSNIDRSDLELALKFHRLKPAGIFTSEDARSYKPRREIFDLALSVTGLQPKDVVHIGDSINSDIKGAMALGIPAIWVNRYDKVVPEKILSVTNLLEVFSTVYF
ncbi:MAG TPA: HAD family hydrolase [Mobilitalea sp.]|nr:HAD family hydrolase [Mobilitalea sp.]